MKNLLIVGAGGHGKVVADCARAMGSWCDISFLDDRSPDLTKVGGWSVVAPIQRWPEFDPARYEVLVAIGENRVRKQLHQQISEAGFTMPVLVHPAAWVSPSADLGAGCVVLAGGVVNVDARLGAASIINTGASVDHDCILGEAVHVSPGAHLGGAVHIGEMSWIGLGAAVKNGIRIGRHVQVGAGAAVVNDIEDNLTVKGVPARVS